MTTLTSIPLNQLTSWDGNVRKTAGADVALAELAASIASIGLLQPLVARPGPDGRHHVIAGNRRLAALHILASNGRVAADSPIPCTVITEAIDATEASLAENIVREQMHPSDQFEAFRDLADKGIRVADIAAKFGVDAALVLKRLKLGRVSPAILQAYRQGKTNLECVMAFTVTEDHKAQEKVWKAIGKHHRTSAWTIRRALTEKEVDSSDTRVQFITLKAYRKAGGITRQDLFTEGDEGIFIVDVALLNDLVQKKLNKAASGLRREGWSWVDIQQDFDYGARSKFHQLDQEYAPLSEDAALALSNLELQLEQLEEQKASWEERSEIGERIDAIQESRQECWSAETLAIAGAVVSIGYQGKTAIHRGLVRPEDMHKLPTASTEERESSDVIARPSGLSTKLVEALTRQRTAALAAELIERPDIALATVAYNLALSVFCQSSGKSCLKVSLYSQSHTAVGGSAAFAEIEKHRSTWDAQLPDEASGLWDWCLIQDSQVLLDLIAFCAALSIDAVVRKRGSMDFGTDLGHADQLATALGLDMNQWFQPTAENYFSKVSKAQILEALHEAECSVSPAQEKAKKAELAALVERQLAGTGWLPQLLRVANPGSDKRINDDC